MLDDLAGLPVPTIAAISGACMGLGMQLALACDLRLATDDARFAVPVAKLGLMVDHWTVQRLALLAGHSTARWMVHDRSAAHRGTRPRGRPGARTRPGRRRWVPGRRCSTPPTELAAQIATLAPLTLAGTKLGLDLLERAAGEIDPDGSYVEAFAAAWASDDLVEGRRAFGERRPAEFEGR